MRLDRVEIKVSFDRETTSDAVEALGLRARSDPWQVHFCEDVTVGTPDTPLLDLGVVLRARVRPDGDDDVTVKLRPCQGSQLPARWTEERHRLKVEADWAGDRHVLAVSFAKKPVPG